MTSIEEQIHEASRDYYGAFDHMLNDWKPVAGFKAGAKWAISQQDDVMEKVIEKVMELRDEYAKKTSLLCDIPVEATTHEEKQRLLQKQYMFRDFVRELNQIINAEEK